MKKLLKLLATSVCLLVGLALVAVLLLNLLKFIIYPEYYSMGSTVCRIPGLSEGFVSQGICASEETGKLLISGYMSNGENSRIYITDEENDSYFVELNYNGKDYKAHAGGIALAGDRVYISGRGRLLILSLSELLSAKDGDTVNVTESVKVNCAASFVYADEQYVYVGEHNYKREKQKPHLYETPGGTNHAIIERYSHESLGAPDKIYSIGDMAQGVCFTPDGRIIISASRALAGTTYSVYLESEAVDSGQELYGAPVYFLGDRARTVRGPIMGQGLDWYNGKVITLFESASNKYVIGKLFFAFDVISLDFD